MFCAGHLLNEWVNLSVFQTLDVLMLADNKLEGQLPEVWVQLSSLRLLDLSANMLNGSLPTGGALA